MMRLKERTEDLMVDLETLGTKNNSVIVQIGACYFDRHTGKIGNQFLMNVDAQSCLDCGMEVEASTIYWWLQQSEEARKSLIGERVDIKTALFKFKRFAQYTKNLWSDENFDFPILKNAYDKVGMSFPVHYTGMRDLRTIVDVGKIDKKSYERVGTYHNALHDSIHQVQYVVDAFKKIGG